MMQNRLWVSAAIIGLVIVVSFALSVPHTREVPQVSEEVRSAELSTGVTLRDSYRRGVHTISGSVVADTACTTVSAEAYLLGEEGSQTIEVALTVPPDTGVCLQVPTPVSFSTTLEAPADLPITVSINGAPASTTMP